MLQKWAYKFSSGCHDGNRDQQHSDEDILIHLRILDDQLLLTFFLCMWRVRVCFQCIVITRRVVDVYPRADVDQEKYDSQPPRHLQEDMTVGVVDQDRVGSYFTAGSTVQSCEEG